MLGIVDLVFVMAQLAGSVLSFKHVALFNLTNCVLVLYVLIDLFYGQFGSASLGIATAISVYSIIICLFVQLIWRIGAVIATSGRNLSVSFDIQVGCPPSQRRETLHILTGAYMWRRFFLYVFTGNTLD